MIPPRPTTEEGRLREALLDALIDAESDDMIGPLYTPDSLADYLAEHGKVRAALAAPPSEQEEPPIEDGECECGLPMSAHAGGYALLHHDNVIRRAASTPVPALDGFTTDELVAELRRRNLRLNSAAELLDGLSEPEILDFVDAGAVTVDQARAILRRLSGDEGNRP